MADALILNDVRIYTGYSHFGSCQEFGWEAPLQGMRSDGPSRFRLVGLRCIDGFEALMIRKDLFLQTPKGEEYILANFQITDITNPKIVRGVAAACRLLMEEFPKVKGIGQKGNVIVSKATHLLAFRAVSALVTGAHTKNQIDAKLANEVVNELVGEIIKAPNSVLNLLAIKSMDDYTFSHNINVATLSMVIGQAMGLTLEELRSLGSGALLHDLGKLRIPAWILNKKGKLSASEFEEITRHPRLGIDLLGNTHDLAPKSREVILQHHEKFEGRGYPDGYSGDNISLFARICAVADVYDALTTQRPFRPAFSPYQAMRTLVGSASTHFDPEILRVFLGKTSLYPPGTSVILNDGSSGVVLRANPGALLRPVVRLLKKEDTGEPLPASKAGTVDLSKEWRRFIIGTLPDPAKPLEENPPQPQLRRVKE